MTAFTNQFSQQSPFDLSIRYEFFGWPTQVANEAIALAPNKNLHWLTAIAIQLEKVIAEAAARPKPRTSGHMQWLASLAREHTNVHITVYRDIVGDFNLLMEAHDTHPWHKESVQSTKVDRFIVFCLWKLVDANTELLNQEPDRDKLKATLKGGAYTMEAMRALQVAQSIKHEEQMLSTRNRENGILANPNAEVNRLKALKMAGDQPFRSMNKAAEYVADNLVKGVTKAGKETFYSIDWIKCWLREAGWTPQHKHKAPK